MENKKPKRSWTLTDEKQFVGCQDFVFNEVNNLLRVYISPKKGRKLAKKLYYFVKQSAEEATDWV